MNTSEELLKKWISEEVYLDYWLEELDLTLNGLQGKRAEGQCVVCKPSDTLITLSTKTGTQFTFRSYRGFVIEPCTDSVDGYQVQVRTPDHKAWVVLRAHLPCN